MSLTEKKQKTERFSWRLKKNEKRRFGKGKDVEYIKTFRRQTIEAVNKQNIKKKKKKDFRRTRTWRITIGREIKEYSSTSEKSKRTFWKTVKIGTAESRGLEGLGLGFYFLGHRE